MGPQLYPRRSKCLCQSIKLTEHGLSTGTSSWGSRLLKDYMGGSQGLRLNGAKSCNLLRGGAQGYMLLLLVSGVGKYHKPPALSQGSPFQIFSTPWSPGPCEDCWGSSTLQGGNAGRPPPFSHICQCILPFRSWLMGYQGCGAQGVHTRPTSDLGDDISSEHCVPGCFMGQVGGQEIDESLNLMNHSIHVGHL